MRTGQRYLRSCATSVCAAAVLLAAPPAKARHLDQVIPNLFGGEFVTSITPTDVTDAQKPLVAQQFKNLSGALSTVRSQVPVPSAGGAFSFKWDPEVDTFVRVEQSLGPLLAERAQTLGKGIGALTFSYTHINFDTVEGESLSDIRTTQPALSASFISLLPPADQARARDNILTTHLDMGFKLDLMFFGAAYGITDTIDVSMALSVSRVRMHGQALATITDPNGDGGAYFTVNQKGVIVGGSGTCTTDFTCASDGFGDSAFGTGDVYLRGKWHFLDTAYADFATAAVLTIPTGNAANFLGYHDPTFTPWFIASKTFGRVSPHINIGYAFRSGQDVSQVQWVAGADYRVTNWLTLATDFLGYHDDKRDGINDNILQSAVGLRTNPFGNFVLSGNLQFPLNRDGLRADVIYTGQIEYTF